MTNFKPESFSFSRVCWACREPITVPDTNHKYMRAYLEFAAPNGVPFPFESIFSGEPNCNNL